MNTKFTELLVGSYDVMQLINVWLYSVGEGAVLDAVFDHFLHPVPSGFDKIIKEKSLL